MRIGIVTDASLDIPSSLIQDEHITIIPQQVHSPLGDWRDSRGESATLARYQQIQPYLKKTEAETSPLPASIIRDEVLASLLMRYDHLLCFTLSSAYAHTNIHVQQAAKTLMDKHATKRESAGYWKPIVSQVIDTRSCTSGAGLVAIHAAEACRKHDSLNTIQQTINKAIERTRTFMVFQDPGYVKTFAKKKLQQERLRTVPNFLDQLFQIKPVICLKHGQLIEVTQQALGFERACHKFFDVLADAIEQPLLKPIVNLSFAGSFDELHGLPGYGSFASHCQHKGVTLHESMLSIGSVVHVGLGTITASLA